jgi:hypothetical protein
MSSLHEPPANRGGDLGGRAPDELDALLRDFFRSEVPQPWPEFAAPEPAPILPLTRPARPWISVRSRVALAASVGLLLTGSLLLPLSENSIGDPAGRGAVIGDIHNPPFKRSNVRTPDGVEFEMKEFLREGKDGPEIRIDFDRR